MVFTGGRWLIIENLILELILYVSADVCIFVYCAEMGEEAARREQQWKIERCVFLMKKWD